MANPLSDNAALRGEGFRVEKSVHVNQPPDALYRFWRDFENLPGIMSHLQYVRVDDPRRSHWVATAPAGGTVEWDAEIIDERPPALISWRSVGDADVDTVGSVRFRPDDRGGTEVRVALAYVPPAGVLGAVVAKLFGEAPDQQIEDDLRRFKAAMERPM